MLVDDLRVRDALQRTWDDAAAVGLTDPTDRTALLPLIFRAHWEGSPATPADLARNSTGAKVDSSSSNEGDALGSVAKWLGLETTQLDGVFVENEGNVVVTISARKLATNKADATRQLAQLVIAARQGSGTEDATTAAEIRAVVSDFGKLDPSNFAAHLSQLDAVASVIGRGASKKFKATRAGREAIADVVRTLAPREL